MRNIQEQAFNNDEKTVNFIYLYRNANKELLYIGVAIDPYLRFRQHKKDKEWFDEIKTVDCAVFSGTRYAVELVENSLIEELNPLYNKKRPETHKNKVDPDKITYQTYQAWNFKKKNQGTCSPQCAEAVMQGYKATGFIKLLDVKEHQLNKVTKVFERYAQLFQNKTLEEMTLDSNDRRALEGIYRSLSWTTDELTQKDEALLQEALRRSEHSKAKAESMEKEKARLIKEQKEKQEERLEATRKALAKRQKKKQSTDLDWVSALGDLKTAPKKDKPAPPVKETASEPEERKDLEKEFDIIDDLNHTISLLRLAIRQRDNEIEEWDEKNLTLEIEIIKLQNELDKKSAPIKKSIWHKLLNLFNTKG